MRRIILASSIAVVITNFSYAMEEEEGNFWNTTLRSTTLNNIEKLSKASTHKHDRSKELYGLHSKMLSTKLPTSADSNARKILKNIIAYFDKKMVNLEKKHEQFTKILKEQETSKGKLIGKYNGDYSEDKNKRSEYALQQKYLPYKINYHFLRSTSLQPSDDYLNLVNDIHSIFYKLKTSSSMALRGVEKSQSKSLTTNLSELEDYLAEAKNPFSCLTSFFKRRMDKWEQRVLDTHMVNHLNQVNMARSLLGSFSDSDEENDESTKSEKKKL